MPYTVSLSNTFCSWDRRFLIHTSILEEEGISESMDLIATIILNVTIITSNVENDLYKLMPEKSQFSNLSIVT